MAEESKPLSRDASDAAESPFLTPESSAPCYRKPRLVPHGQLKPAGFLLGSPPDPP